MKIIVAALFAVIATVCWFGNLTSYSCYKYERQTVHHEQYVSTDYMFLGPTIVPIGDTVHEAYDAIEDVCVDRRKNWSIR